MRRLLFILTFLLAAAGCAFAIWQWSADDPAGASGTRGPQMSDDAGRAKLRPSDIPPGDDVPTTEADTQQSATGEERTLALRFEDPDGIPLAGTEIIAAAPGYYPPIEARSDETGVARLTFSASSNVTPEIHAVELVARSGDRSLARWSSVDWPDAGDLPSLRLEPAETVAIRVVSPTGYPVSGATVRLSKRRVGLLNITETVDASGRAVFGTIPPGEYVLSARAPGFLRDVSEVSVPAPTEAVLVLETGGSATGKVTDTNGMPVPGALVAIYRLHVSDDELEPAGQPGSLEGVPTAMVETDLTGEFYADGLPPGRVRAVAFHEKFAPSSSQLGTMRPPSERAVLDIVMREGFEVRTRVVSESDEPVAHAYVSWRDPISGLSEAGVTDQQGMAVFQGAPHSAVFRARRGRWISGEKSVGRPGADGVVSMNLTLRNPGGTKPIRLRVVPWSEDARIESVSTVGQNGLICDAVRTDEFDWRFPACEEGPVQLRLETAEHGAYSKEVELEDALQVDVPSPPEVSVEVRSENELPSESVDFSWNDGKAWNSAPTSQIAAKQRRWEHRLFPGDYEVRARTSGMPAVEEKLRVTPTGGSATIHLVPRTERRVLVLDSQRSPVTGAYLMLWSADGRLMEVKRSAGQLPTSFRAPSSVEAHVLAVDPRRGEDSTSADFSENRRGPVELVLDAAVLSISIPGHRLTPSQLESELEAPLIRDRQGLRIDVTREDSPAARAGIERGEWVVTAWKARDVVRLVTWSRDGFREIELPSD